MTKDGGNRVRLCRWSMRVLFLGLCWTGSGFLLAALFSRPLPQAPYDPPPRRIQTEQNEFGAFSIIEIDPANGARPVRGFRFDRLESSCGRVGLFQTAACRALTLTNLQVNLFSYPDETGHTDPASAVMRFENQLGSAGPWPLLYEQLVALSTQRYSEATVEFPEWGHTVQLTADGFEMNWYDGGSSALSVQSRRAVLSPEQTESLQLRGRVIIRSGPRTLEAGRVLWDPRRMEFAVLGGCVLRDSEGQHLHRDIRVDSRLNTQTKQLSSEPKGAFEWLAKH